MLRSDYPQNVYEFRPAVNAEKSASSQSINRQDESVENVTGALHLLAAYSRQCGHPEIAEELRLTELRVSYLADTFSTVRSGSR